MAAEVQIVAVFTESNQGFTATFNEKDKGFTAKFGETTTVMPDPYEGEYEVTPTVEGFVLPTKHKSMTDDLSVLEIPYAEVSNVDGKTVIIA